MSVVAFERTVTVTACGVVVRREWLELVMLYVVWNVVGAVRVDAAVLMRVRRKKFEFVALLWCCFAPQGAG